MGRAPCCDKNGLKKGPWTPEEDQKLIDYIQKHGYGSWRTLPKNAGLARCGKSCRLRWTNYLRPDIKRGRFSLEEEETIIQLHSILGNKWSAIASRLPGRTDNEIKNYWNTHIRKRLLSMGIDPVTHAPRLDLLELSSLINSSGLYNPTAQLDMSRFIALEPLVNSQLLRMATDLLSSQCQSSNRMDQQGDQLQEAHAHQLISASTHPQVQDQFAVLFQATQSGAQEVSPCSSISNAQLLGEAQLTRADIDHQLQQDAETNLWQDMASAFIPHTAGLASSIHDQACNLSTGRAINGNVYNYMNPVMPTPSSSPTTLNSTLTCWNSTSAEDEKDSYCSNMFKFPVPDLLDVGNYL